MEVLQSMPELLFDDSGTEPTTEPPGTVVGSGSGDEAEASLSSSSSGVASQPPAEPTDCYDELILDLIDDVIFGFCLEVHRAAKYGTLFLDDIDADSRKSHEIIDRPGVDIFGQVPSKKSLECTCPQCHRCMAASRFAPHLEKCMGMGRNSWRLASRRIANAGKHESDNDSVGGDDNNDNDWSYYGERKSRRPMRISAKKVKKEKAAGNSPRRVKLPSAPPPPKVRSSEGAGELSYQTVLANMTWDERRTLLLNICAAVTSEQTRKLCTRSVRCTQHTEEQRQASRNLLLSRNPSSSRLAEQDEDQVDVDTYDDMDGGQALRDTLEWDVTPSSSPADSTSTVNSSESRQRGRGRKGRPRKE